MAATFIRATLHAQDFTKATIYVKIDETVVKNVALGGGALGTAGWGILGAGQPGIFGLALNPCLISAASTSVASTTALDPPVTYTFCNATSPYGRDFLNLNLKMIRGNDYSFNIQVVLNGNAVNLSGGTLRMTAKWRLTDADADEVFSVYSPNNGITFISQTAGTATVKIASALTNVAQIPYHRVDLPYDIEYTDASGNIFTVMYGTLTILPNASRTSP